MGGDWTVKIPIQVSLDRPEPLYHQITTQLRLLIMSGRLKEGDLLPSIRELAQDLSCSVITIRRVYQDLEREGLLRTRQGTGTFVAKVGEQDIENHRYKAVSKAMNAAIQTARQHQFSDKEILEMFSNYLQQAEGSEGE